MHGKGSPTGGAGGRAYFIFFAFFLLLRSRRNACRLREQRWLRRPRGGRRALHSAAPKPFLTLLPLGPLGRVGGGCRCRRRRRGRPAGGDQLFRGRCGALLILGASLRRTRGPCRLRLASSLRATRRLRPLEARSAAADTAAALALLPRRLGGRRGGGRRCRRRSRRSHLAPWSRLTPTSTSTSASPVEQRERGVGAHLVRVRARVVLGLELGLISG